MEGSTTVATELDGRDPALASDKARRIVAAMRSSVGQRGAAASTFDHVAQEAGVSRGLLHYYFGSKERLLVAVVRHDCEIRMRALEEGLSAAGSVDAIVGVLVQHLEDLVDRDPDAYALVFELFSASRHNEDLRREMAELYRKIRDQIAGALRSRQRDGAVELRGGAEGVAAVLMALGDGMALQLLSDPDWQSSEAFRSGILTARYLLGGPPADAAG